jgi:cytochrome d ubiquinol oxidase subunit II
MSALTSIGLPEIIAGLMLVALTAYALTGGADFGGGVWDLLARGPRRERQRQHIAASLAPIWEANHVWLIIVVVLLFTAFPSAFQAIMIVLHIPLTIVLVGIVLRGSAFVFRAYGARTSAARQRWGATFAIASIITPTILGAGIGALSTGKIGDASRLAETGAAPFADVYVAPWLGVFPVVTGLLALTLFAFLAAVYLAHGSRDPELREDFRKRALFSAAAVFLLSALALAMSYREAPRVATGVTGAQWAVPLHVFTGIAAIAAIWALVARRHQVARVAAASQVVGILWGWALSQYPYIVPDVATIRSSAAPRPTLVLVVVGLAVGTAILAPALRYLFALFTRADVPANADEPRGESRQRMK